MTIKRALEGEISSVSKTETNFLVMELTFIRSGCRKISMTGAIVRMDRTSTNPTIVNRVKFKINRRGNFLHKVQMKVKAFTVLLAVVGQAPIF